MPKLPLDIQIEFFKLIGDEVSINDFEQWLYVQDTLEQELGSDTYIELISINYSSRHAKHEMRKVIAPYLDFSLFEERKLKKILDDLINRTDDFAKSLIATYDLYCYGYSFFNNLGLGYGLTFSEDFYVNSDWENLSEEQKNKRIGKIHKGVKEEAKLVLSWIEHNKIILTGEIDENHQYDYIDHRCKAEKGLRTLNSGYVSPDSYSNRQTNIFLARRKLYSFSLFGCLQALIKSLFQSK